jgi:hypothetical protein
LSKGAGSRSGRRKAAEKNLVIPYTAEESNLFDTILRPRVSISLYSRVFSQWITIDDVLADTGADISILPKSLGILLVGQVRQGKRYRMTGLMASSVRYFYLHQIRTKLGKKKLDTVFAVALRDDIPPTLGRIKGLDRMNIEYKKGRQIVISW